MKELEKKIEYYTEFYDCVEATALIMKDIKSYLSSRDKKLIEKINGLESFTWNYGHTEEALIRKREAISLIQGPGLQCKCWCHCQHRVKQEFCSGHTKSSCEHCQKEEELPVEKKPFDSEKFMRLAGEIREGEKE